MSGMTTKVKLGAPDVASVILGQSPESSTYNKDGHGVPFFQGKADFGLLHPIPRVWCNAGRKFASQGDILLSVRAPVGDVNIATDNCAIGRGIAAIRAGSHTDPWFLYFALLYSKPILESRATGSTFANVNKATLLNLDIPFIDMSKQVKIGASLRELVNKVKQEMLVFSGSHNLKRATMQALFAQGLRGELSKETEVGLIPESWGLNSFGSLFEITQGFSLKGNLSNDGEGVPFLRTSNVYWGRVKSDTVSRMYIDSELIQGRTLKRGDLLVCEGGEIGRAAIWNDEIENCTFQNHLYRLRPISLSYVIPKFAMFWLEEGFCHRNAYTGVGNQTTIPNLSRARLAEMLIPVPPLKEQQEIVTILDAINEKINMHRKKTTVLNTLFKSLLCKLMTGEIRVTDLNLSELKEITS